MKKKIFVATGVTVISLSTALLAGGNYFYSQSVKRGEEIELYRGEEAVPVAADKQNQTLLTEARAWYDNQKFETLEQTSYDGLTLKAKLLANDQPTGKAVILAHGYRDTGEMMGDLVKFYYDQGFDVLLPDARGHGESEGDYIGYGWHDRIDYLGWIDRLIQDYQSESIFLHGSSMGAALVLMTSGEDLPQEVKGIIADSGYTSVKDELVYQMKQLYRLPSFPMIDITSAITNLRSGYHFAEASAVEQVKKNTRPLFIIHGADDELVPTEMAYTLYEAAKGEKELWIVPDAGHVAAYTVATAEFQQRLQAFIDNALAESFYDTGS